MHGRVGAYAVEKGVDVLVCIGSLSKSMYEEAGKTAQRLGISEGNLYYFPEKKDFLGRWQEILQKGDTLLVKASHGMAFEEIVKRIAEH